MVSSCASSFAVACTFQTAFSEQQLGHMAQPATADARFIKKLQAMQVEREMCGKPKFSSISVFKKMNRPKIWHAFRRSSNNCMQSVIRTTFTRIKCPDKERFRTWLKQFSIQVLECNSITYLLSLLWHQWRWSHVINCRCNICSKLTIQLLHEL